MVILGLWFLVIDSVIPFVYRLINGSNLDIVHGSLAGQTFLAQVVYKRPRQNFAYDYETVKFGISHLQLVNKDY